MPAFVAGLYFFLFQYDYLYRQGTGDTTVKQLCMNLHFFRSLVSAMNMILGHYDLIILLELMV